MAPAPAPGLSRAEQGTAGKICPAPRLGGVNEPRRDDIPGWGRGAAWTDPGAPSVGRTLATSLAELGVERAFGVLGGGIAPFAAGLAASPIRFLHTRHEAGAVFAAIEAHFATGRPVLAVVTTGPGLFNALGGVMAARADGARLLLVSGATARTLVGRGAVQETSAHHLPGGLGQAGAMFHAAWQPESVDELPAIVSALAQGWGRPGGFVAHLALPLTLQTQLVGPDTQLTPPRWHQALPEPDPRVLDLVLDRLGGRAVVWVGHGARAAGPELATFVRAAQLPVLTTPRAKGVFPERDPLHLGVSGTGSSAGVDSFLAARPLDGALVLGTRLGEVSSLLSPRVVPRAGWVHVDLDPTAFAAAFPGTAGLGVVADCGRFLAALHVRATATGWYRRAHHPPMLLEAEPTAPSPRPDGDVGPAYLMHVVQELVVDGSDAVVMSEAGNAFSWCNHALRFASPGRYRTSAAWGSMGHFSAGAIGAAAAADRPVVAVVGDGAMLMNNEINTAVAYGLRVVWIVLNDAQLGLNQHGMTALGMTPVETQLPRTDFATFARCQGAIGLTVEREPELAPALAQALALPGPVVVDVRIDPTVPAPIVADRIRGLLAQGGGR